MLPSGGGDARAVILDLGANVVCTEENLFDFALMGSVYAETIGKMSRPKLGILNIGAEETKGDKILQHLNKILSENKESLPYEYIGFVEANDISGSRVQVVVTDGWTGNVVLKTIEGTAKLVKRVLMDTLKNHGLRLQFHFF